MNLLNSISDFIELYLSIDLPKKEIELLKVRSFCSIKNEDILEQTVNSFRKVLSNTHKHYLKFRFKSHYALPDKLESILHLSPEDFLLLIGVERYVLSPDTLSIILKLPIDTVKYRIEHLKKTIQLTDAELKEIHLKLIPIEKRRYSQIQKLKIKFRPQSYLYESFFIMFAVVLVLWSIPTLKNKYEKWIQKKTSEYFVSGAIKDAPISPELDIKPTIIEPSIIAAAEELPIEGPKAERKQPRAIEGEVWRFSFTGSAKIDLEKEVKGFLEKHSEQSVHSSVAPGGIQYETLLKVSELIPLKIELEGLADSQSQSIKMSWYKKKKMATKKIPSDHVEVVIWISTI